MIEHLRNLKTSEIELRQQLPALECEWLVGRLLATRGVATARWVANTRRLLIQYDADFFAAGRSSLPFCSPAVFRLRYPAGLA